MSTTSRFAAPPSRFVPGLTRGWRPLARLKACEAGVAAIEFALILPVMVTMFLGHSEITLAVNTDRKLVLLSRSLADISSRVQSLTTADMTDIFKAAAVVMQPYNASKLQMVVTSMKVTKVGSAYQGTVDWSCANGPSATPKSSAQIYTVPPAFQSDGTYYMLVDTIMPYKPVFGSSIISAMNLGQSTPWPIRNTGKVTLTGGCPT